MRERDIRKLLKERVEAHGGEIRAVSWLGRAHAPDVLCGFPAGCRYSRRMCRDIWDGPWDIPQGWSYFVETKRPGKNATEGQAREHERMRSWGCYVQVITTPEELDAWLPPT
jgi:hypothetical protein